jgi:hypothetical protein
MRELVNLLEAQVVESTGSSDQVSSQRERNHRYYALQPLGNEIRGRSQHISPDVLDVVEQKKAYFRETFFSGRRVVKFSPGSDGQQKLADMRTAYVEQVLRRNHWYRVVRDGLHDAFVAKRMVLLVDWYETTRDLLIDVEDATDLEIGGAIMARADQADVLDVDDSQLEETPTGKTGTARVVIDDSRVRLQLIQPERYHRDPNATYPGDAAYATYEEDVTRGDLIRWGFDEDQVLGLKPDYRFRRNEEDFARKAHDSSAQRVGRSQARTDLQEVVTVYCTYTWLRLDDIYPDAGYAPEERLYRIWWAHGEVLERGGAPAIDEQEEQPFFEWAQYKVSHAEMGLCDADITAHLQRTTSTMKRLIVDNQQMANMTRWSATKGGVVNPRDLLSPEIGGVVWTTGPDMVQPLNTPQLSPLALGVLEMMETDKEARTGNTRLAKGMNKDAVSEQNAASMIERLTNSANRRIMGECRDFAEDFIGPVMRRVYELGVRHDRRVYTLEVAGVQERTTPDALGGEPPQYVVNVALTPEETAKYSAGLLSMHQLLSTDQQLSQLYGVAQRHALADALFDSLGVTDTSPYMMVPGGEEHQQMMQAVQQAQQQAQQQQMQQQQLMEMMQQLQAKTLQSADEREWYKAQLDAARAQADALNLYEDNVREDEKLAHNKVVDLETLDIERKKATRS